MSATPRGAPRLCAQQRAQITGLVLAGGLGSRMSPDGAGTDKGLMPFRGRPMVAQVIERFAPQVGPLLVNANRNFARYAAFGRPLVPDALAGHAGPLAGLHAGMRAARTRWIATTPCDSPFIPDDLIVRLWAGLHASPEGGARIAVARTGARAHPVFMLAECSLLESLEAFLASGRRRIDAWYAPLDAVEVDFPEESAFLNINTPDDLREHERS